MIVGAITAFFVIMRMAQKKGKCDDFPFVMISAGMRRKLSENAVGMERG